MRFSQAEISPRRGGVVWLVVLCALLAMEEGGVRPLAAAGAAPDPAAVERQAREVERLKQELKAAEQRLETLQGQPEQRGPGTASAPAPVPAAATNAVAKAVPVPVPTTPVLPEEVVRAEDLCAHFAADPEAAARRYGGQQVRVAGQVEGFAGAMFQRTYGLRLAGADRRSSVVCEFNYLGRYQSVTPRDKGKTLVGRIDERSVRVLHRVGTSVTIVGRCQGAEDGDVVLTGCALVP